MRKQLPRLDNPLNADERALYNVAIRLDRIIELLEFVIEDKVEIKIPEVSITSEVEVKPSTKKKTTKKK